MPRTSRVDLPGTPEGFRALCGDALGLVKLVEAAASAASPQVVARWGQPDPQQSIISMSVWPDMEEFAVARKNGKMDVMDSHNGALRSQLLIPTSLSDESATRSSEGAQQHCDIHLFRQASSRARTVLSVSANRILAIQPALDSREDDNQASPVSEEGTSGACRWRLCDTGTLSCFKVDNGETRAVYGGRGLDVHMWDLDTGSNLWTAKLPKKDNLGLVSVPHVTAVTFLSHDDHRKVVTGTGNHQVRLYDVQTQRRPVRVVEHGESPITSIVQEDDGYTVHIGTGAGDLASLDMRTGRSLGSFKGAVAGSIRAVVRHPCRQLLASCGLDRYLRVHDVKTRQLLAKVFLKQQLVALGFNLQPTRRDSQQLDTCGTCAVGTDDTLPAAVEEELTAPAPKRKKGLLQTHGSRRE